MYFYQVPANVNGKMSQQVYIYQSLEPIVMPWVQAHSDFILEEDGNLGHGPEKSNIVRTWKEENELESNFNCHDSLDLTPLENFWQPVKQALCKHPH